MVIQSIMLFALGFFIASLIAIVLIPLVWSRSSQMTRIEMTASLPLSEQEIAASRDKLRAEHALEMRRIENQLEALKETHAHQKIDLNKQLIDMQALKQEIHDLSQDLSEKNSQINILNQKYSRNLPHLEEKVERLMELLIECERENEHLRRLSMHSGVDTPDEAYSIARLEEMEHLRNHLKEEIDQGSGHTRTLLEQAESLSDENREMLHELIYLRAKVLDLMEREEYETSYLRGEMQQLAHALMEEGAGYSGFTQTSSHLPMLPVSSESEDDGYQLPFDFDLEEKKPPPKFIEKAAIAAAAKQSNPTLSPGSEISGNHNSSLTDRLESLLKKSVK